MSFEPDRRSGKSKRKSTRRMRRTLKTKQKGGDPLPDKSSLSLEFIFNDSFYEKYSKFFLEDVSTEELEELKEEIKNYKKTIMSFMDDIKDTNGIPYSINTLPPNLLEEYLDENINPDDDICKGKIHLDKIASSFFNTDHPTICILLKSDTKIIGIVVFSFTHRHIQQGYANKTNKTKNYIHIDWLCGSKYKNVGSILIDTIDKIQQYMHTDATHLISYNSAIPFYKKMGYNYLGLSYFRTPMMEKKYGI